MTEIPDWAEGYPDFILAEFERRGLLREDAGWVEVEPDRLYVHADTTPREDGDGKPGGSPGGSGDPESVAD